MNAKADLKNSLQHGNERREKTMKLIFRRREIQFKYCQCNFDQSVHRTPSAEFSQQLN